MSLPQAPPTRSRRTRANSAPHPTPAPPSSAPEIVDPRWLLKAAAAVAGIGLLCAYATLCAFFYIGQWQFVLHPSRTVSQTPAALHLAFQPVQFGDDRSGQPQLTGWWIPGEGVADHTVLVLHGETGTMSDALPAAQSLHDAHLNVLLFDYRGYGQSQGRHPTERLMQADAEAALKAVPTLAQNSSGNLLVYGQELGASLAVQLCAKHPEVAGLILESADGDTASRVEADQRSRIIPVGLLFHERFPLADTLHNLHTPKLLISFTRAEAPEAYQRAADPKMTVGLAPTTGKAAIGAEVRRFLDMYGRTPQVLPVPKT